MTAISTFMKKHTMSGLYRILAVAAVCLLGWNSANAQPGAVDINNPSAQVSQTDANYSIGAPEQDFYVLSEPNDVTAGRGFGMWFRIGHIAGQAIGREESITHVELSPYVFTQHNGILFGSARFFRTNRGDLGGNGGVGYRHYLENKDRILGIAAWYDRDDTLDEIFEQVTFSLESLGNWFDWRMNVYIPIGDTQRDLGVNVVSGSERFSGNNIVFDLRRSVGAALQGFDMEFGTPINFDFARRFDMRVHAGFYFFEDDVVDNVAGWTGRLEAHPFPTIAMNLGINDDDTFGTRVQFGVDWTFDPGKTRGTGRRKSTYDRMTIPVRRLYTVVVSQESRIETDNIALNPSTGLPYVIRHVNSAAPGPGDGSITDPFTTIQDAQFDTAYDIIYAHAESQFAGPLATIVTDANRDIFGEGAGVEYTIPVNEVGTITLPRATAGNALPELLNAPGTAVTLTDGAEFSGFTITSPAGDGLVADSVDFGSFRFLTINDAGGRGVALINNSGGFDAEENTINNSTGNAFEVVGGTAGIAFINGEINNSSGRIVSINGITDGFVNMTGTTLNDDGGLGIEILNTAGSVTIDNATIANSTVTGIDVQNTTGLVSFLNTTTINNAAGVAFNIQDTQLLSQVNVFDLDIINTNDVGINLNNISGNVDFFGATNIDNLLAGTGIFALEFQNSSGNVAFTSLGINSVAFGGSPFGSAIHIGNTTSDNSGTFTVTGPVQIGTIFGENILIEDDDSTVTFENSVNIAGFFEEGVVVQNNRGQVRFQAATTVGGGTAAGVDIQNNSGSTFFQSLTVNTNVGPTAALNVINNVGPVSLNSVTIDTTTADGVFGLNNDQFSIGAGTILATNATAVDIENSDININLTTVDADGADHGIRLVNDTGLFTVQGGTIGNMTIAGLFTDEVDVNDTNLLDVTAVGVTFDTNEVGISTTNLDSLTLDSLTVTNSLSFGLDTLNTRLLTLSQSTFTDNAGPLESIVRLQVNDVLDASLPYQWVITNNDQTFTENDSDFILMNTLPGGESSILEFVVNANNFVGTGGEQTIIQTTWNGQLSGIITNNLFTLVDAANAGGVLVGLDIGNASTTELTTMLVQNNLFEINSQDGDDIGIRFGIAGGSDIDIVDNGINLRTGPLGTGMIFNLASAADVRLDTNSVFVDVAGGDGILFQFVNGPSLFTLDNNLVEVVDTVPGFIQERGIVFAAVTGLINLNSNSDNGVVFTGADVDGGEQFFFIPPGTSTGQLLINGFSVP